ncbi:MAG TPA: outer membrane beta-barrel protein [Chitinophagaceae bacterium]|nr:outer membrane beta-barrel protein [Chitinophagaceae bacterium]
MKHFFYPSFFLFLFLGLCCHSLLAQEIGIQGGFSLPDLRGNLRDPQAYLSRSDGCYGIYGNFKINKQFSILAELNYCGEGGRRDGIQPIPSGSMKDYPPSDTFYSDYQNSTILHYLELPVLARLTWGKQVKYFIEGGIFTGYLMDARLVTSGKGVLYSDPAGRIPASAPPGGDPFSPQILDNNTDISKQINRINIGIIGGGGILYDLGRNQFSLDLRISEGMLHIYRNTHAGGKYNTGNVLILLGYGFRL